MSDISGTHEPNPPEGETETVRGSAGEARRLAGDITPALDNTPGRLTEEEVAAKQERISSRRKPAGPERADMAELNAFSEEGPAIPDVPPTGTTDSPALP